MIEHHLVAPDRSQPGWRESVYAQLLALYEDDEEYHAGNEGAITQMAHALQAANEAVLAQAPTYTVVAALLHDVGWKLTKEAPRAPDAPPAPPKNEAVRLGLFCTTESTTHAEQLAKHDVVGAAFLRLFGFAENVAFLVEGHVLAKRYLCWKDPTYFDGLSDNSRFTLGFQGGPMAEAEATAFAKNPLFETCIMMRIWDDDAKYPEKVVPAFDTYKSMIFECLADL